MRRVVAAGLVVAASVAVLSTAGAPSAPAQEQAITNLMVVGDSGSHGMEGDRTWRYHLATHLRGLPVDFVGPWKGTNRVQPRVPEGFPTVANPPATDGKYYPGITFDPSHYAFWGRSMRTVRGTIAAQLRIRAAAGEAPDYLLVVLGTNDLAWGLSGPQALRDDALGLIAAARSVDPDLRFLVANVPNRAPTAALPRLPGDTAAYNALLPAALAAASTPRSPVGLVDLNSVYNPRVHSWDGLHPNALGEWVIARRVADRLSASGIGGRFPSTPPSALPDLRPAAPRSVSARTGTGTITLSWPHVFGSAGYEIYVRDATAGQAYVQVPWPIPAYSYRFSGTVRGHEYRFKIRSYRGYHVSDSSPILRVTAR